MPGKKLRRYLPAFVIAFAMAVALPLDRALANISDDGGQGTRQVTAERLTADTARTISAAVSKIWRNLKSTVLRADHDGTIGDPTAVVGAQDGGIPQGIGIWGNGSYDHMRETPTDFVSTTKTFSAVAGADRFVTDQLLLGLAITGAHSKTDAYNYFGPPFPSPGGAPSNSIVDLQQRNYGGALYGGYIISDNVFVDFNAGWTWDRYEQISTRDGAPGVLNTAYDTDGHSLFAGANLYVSHNMTESFGVTGKLGFLRTYNAISDTFDFVNGAGANFVQGQKTSQNTYTLGGEANWAASPNVMLYGGADIEIFGDEQVVGLNINTAGRSGTNLQNRHQWQVRLRGGADFYEVESWTFSAEAGTTLAREDADNISFGFNARYDF